MKKCISVMLLVFFLWNSVCFSAEILTPNIQTNLSLNPQIDILKDGITANNAGKIMSKRVFTGGILDMQNLKFTIVPGVKIGLNPHLVSQLQNTNTTRENFKNAKKMQDFTAKARYEDTIIEYPDRVRIITTTKYQYFSQNEYQKIFSGALSQTGSKMQDMEISQQEVEKFLSQNPEYANYAQGIPKVSKKDLIQKITEKSYAACQKKSRLASSCQLENIRNAVSNEISQFKGERTITETIDVNKIPLIYELDANKKNIETRLRESNISQNPQDVRISANYIKNSFLQYTSLSSSGNIFPIQGKNAQTKEKNCDGLEGKNYLECTQELEKLLANTQGTNIALSQSGTLLNGFTLGKSYSYSVSDSASVLGFEVYDVGFSYYVGYGVGIRVPIDVTIETSKDRLEVGTSENYEVTLKVDTVNKPESWFEKHLESGKVFAGKEAVLEAGAYIKGHVDLFEENVLQVDLGGKYDWGSDIKIPYGNEQLEIFEGIAYGENLGIKLVLYGITISGDLKAEGNLKGKIDFECRTLHSQGISQNAQKCRDILQTTLKDTDITDIRLESAEPQTLQFQAKSDTFYYQNALGVYAPYGIRFNNFKYIPELSVDLSLRAKIGVDTGDYFGHVWIAKTGWMEIYSFELDLPALKNHEGYTLKQFDNYTQNYLYNFTKNTQDVDSHSDISVSCPVYTPQTEKKYLLSILSRNFPNISSNSYIPKNYYDYSFGGNMGYKDDATLVFGDDTYYTPSNTQPKNYFTFPNSVSYENNGKLRYVDYGYMRKTENTLKQDFENNTVSEIQYMDHSSVYYYSQAKNSIYRADIASEKAGFVAITPISETQYATLSSLQKPVKNQFQDLDQDQYGYESLVEIGGTTPTFQKFHFTFSPNFSSSKLFAYIAKDTHDQYSIPIYKNGRLYREISPDLIDSQVDGTPVFVQFVKNENNSEDLIVIGKTIDPIDQTQIFTISEYAQNTQGEFVYQFQLDKKIARIPEKNLVMGMNYSALKKTLYVTSLQNNVSTDFYSHIEAFRFNGQKNTAYKTTIYTLSGSTKQQIIESFGAQNQNIFENNYDFRDLSAEKKGYSFISHIQAGKDENSLLLGIQHFFATPADSYSQKYIKIYQASEVSFSLQESEKNNQGECQNQDSQQENIPKIESKNVSPTPPPSSPTDPYVLEKLDEIQQCFYENYQLQLENIDQSLRVLQEQRDLQKDEITRKQYDNAMLKLQNIKQLFLEKYTPILGTEKY